MIFTSFIDLTPFPDKGENETLPVNPEAIFYLEEGIRKKDGLPYTVIHSSGGNKLIVTEPAQEIRRMCAAKVQHLELAVKGVMPAEKPGKKPVLNSAPNKSTAKASVDQPPKKD